MKKRDVGSIFLLEKIRKRCFFCFFLLQISFHLLANNQHQNYPTRITLNMNNTTLKNVLNAIERQTGFSFYFNEKQVDVQSIVSVNVFNETINGVLNKILKNYDYKVANNKIIITPIVCSSQPTSVITLMGIVLDENGIPLVGASVCEPDSKKTVFTNREGRYIISVPDTVTYLKVSSIGSEGKTVKVGTRKTTVNVVLPYDSQNLNEILVVGYGTQLKKDITGSIAGVSVSKLENNPTTNVAQRLQGKVPGLQVTNELTSPGAVSKLRIRGEKSFSAGSTPLIVWNGMPFNGSLNDIDQNSIENISILKDASAAAIYGARSSNGVILITSKKGYKGKAVVTYKSLLGFQSPERIYNLMKGDEYIRMLKEFYRDRGDSEISWSNPENFLYSALKENYRNRRETDWQDAIFKVAFQQEHQLSVSGGTEHTSYYMSISYLDQDGIVENTGFKKYSGIMNISQKIKNWLNIGFNIQLNQKENGGVTPTYYNAYRMSPYASLYDEDNNYLRYPMSEGSIFYNPYADIDGIRDDVGRDIYTKFSMTADLPLKGLSLATNLGFSYKSYDLGLYYGSNTMLGEPYNGIASITNNNNNDWIWENSLTYNYKTKKHLFDIVGMVGIQKTQSMYSFIEANGFLNDKNSYHNIGMAKGEKIILSDLNKTSMLSYMGRANYNYKNCYLFTVTGRSDGYSAFGENNKWGFFPSFASAWVISQENFFLDSQLSEKINFLKIKISVGKNGNQSVNAYRTYSKLVQKDYISEDGVDIGLVSNFSTGNKKLKWESTTSFNSGLETSFFQNRLQVNFDTYLSYTKDVLMSRSVASMNGYTNFWDNVGKTENKGFEIEINSINVKTPDFKWETNLGLSGNWNKILELTEDRIADTQNAWFVGQPLRVFYNYKVIGIWQNEEREAAADYRAVPGDAKLLDKNKDGQITPEDRTIIGSRLPVWNLGLTNTLTYRNWSFTIFLNGTFDITKENYSLLFSRMQFDNNTNYISGIDYWTPENSATEATRLDYKPAYGHLFYMDASFFRIQNMSVSYMVPPRIVTKWGIQELKLSLNGQNIYTFSKTSKYAINPEQRTLGGETGNYPVSRVFAMGLNVTF